MMKSLIQTVLNSNTEGIRNATNELDRLCKNAEAFKELYDIVSDTANTEGERQLALNILIKTFKSLGWYEVPNDVKDHIKATIMQMLLDASSLKLHKNIAQLLGSILRYDHSAWKSDVMHSLYECCSAGTCANLCGIAAATIDVLADVVPDFMAEPDCLSGFLQMLDVVLHKYKAQNQLDAPVVVHLMEAMGRLVSKVVPEDVDNPTWTPVERVFERCIPMLLESLGPLATLPEAELFLASFSLLDSLDMFDSKVLVPHYAPLLDFCLSIAANPTYQLPARIRCAAFVDRLVQNGTAADANKPILERIVPLVFNIMCFETYDPEDEDENEDFFQPNDLLHPVGAATCAMSSLSEVIETKRLLPLLSSILTPALASTNEHCRRAAYVAMAVTLDGCCNGLPAEYLEHFMGHIKVGLLDTPMVRNAAFYALEQYVDGLQPEIGKYTDIIMQLFFENLKQLSEHLCLTNEPPRHMRLMFRALESTCLYTDNGLTPFLPTLMQILLPAMANRLLLKPVLKVVRGCTVTCKIDMLPYFKPLMLNIGMILCPENGETYEAELPTAIEALAEFARHMGKDNFQPFLGTCINYALRELPLCKDDGLLKSSLFGLMGGISTVMGEDMQQILSPVVENMFLVLMRDCEIESEFNDLEDDSDADSLTSEQAERIEKEIDGIDTYFAEREEAVQALQAFSENCGTAFLPYVKKAEKLVSGLLDLPDADLREACIHALVSFVALLHKVKSKELRKYSHKAIKCFADEILEGDDSNVVEVAAFGLSEILELQKLKSDSLRDTLYKCFSKTLAGKLVCMDEELPQERTSVFKKVLNVLPTFGTSMDPPEFKRYVSKLKPQLMGKLKRSKHPNEFRDAECAHVCFIFGEIFAVLKDCACEFFLDFKDVFIHLMSRGDENIRLSAPYALGSLVLHSGQIAHPHFPNILNAIGFAVERETNRRTKDNQISALARVIAASPAHAQLEISLPLLMKHLPIELDYSENKPVTKCIKLLYAEYAAMLEPFTAKIMDLSMQILMEERYSEDEAEIVKECSINILKTICQVFKPAFDQYLQANPKANEFLIANYSQH